MRPPMVCLDYEATSLCPTLTNDERAWITAPATFGHSE